MNVALLHAQSVKTTKAVIGGVLQKKAFLKIFSIFTLVLDSLLNEAAGFQAFIIERLQHRCFPVNIVKFLRSDFLKNICERLLWKQGMRKH